MDKASDIKISRAQKILEQRLLKEVPDRLLPSPAVQELTGMTRINTWRPGALHVTLRIVGLIFALLVVISVLSFNWLLLAIGTGLLLFLGAIFIFPSWTATCTECKKTMQRKLTRAGRIKYSHCENCNTYSQVFFDWGKAPEDKWENIQRQK